MDLLRFINSKDIRKHLETINYDFSSLEAAWLIYQCRNATIEEKHRAWDELIRTMPDCRIEERRGDTAQESLHRFLRRYMELEDKFVTEFREGNWSNANSGGMPYVYRFGYLLSDGCMCEDSAIYSSFSRLCEAVDTSEEEIDMIRCVRTRLDEPDEKRWVLYMTTGFEPLSIDPLYIESEEDGTIFDLVFLSLWFDFPTPFQKGDIVWNPRTPDGFCAGPFVTTGVCLDGIESERVKQNIRKGGDTSDMCAGGYFLNEDGSIYQECMSNYMNLEFYEKELTGAQRTLIALSSFLKGEIDPALFARAYHQIVTVGYADDSMPQDYLKSGLILAGLSNPEHVKIWLDDLRDAPAGYYHCRSVNEAKNMIIKCEKEYAAIEVIDCDHDLGDYASDGGDGIKLLDWLVERKSFYPIVLHTMNPVGRENMEREIGRYWKLRED